MVYYVISALYFNETKERLYEKIHIILCQRVEVYWYKKGAVIIMDSVREQILVDNQKVIEYNNKLFCMFESMIKPFQDLEYLCQLRRNKSSEIEQYEYWRGRYDKKKIMVFFLLIIFYIVFYLFTPHYDKHEMEGIPYIIKIYGCGFLSILLTSLIGAFRHMNQQRKNSKNLKSAKLQFEQIEEQIQNRIQSVTEHLQFIPPSYRHSDAMKYFSRAYLDGKVDNLKEAMESYDTYLHRLNMERSQKMIVQQQNIMLHKQDQIVMNQIKLSRQVSLDTSLVLLSNLCK